MNNQIHTHTAVAIHESHTQRQGTKFSNQDYFQWVPEPLQYVQVSS